MVAYSATDQGSFGTTWSVHLPSARSSDQIVWPSARCNIEPSHTASAIAASGVRPGSLVQASPAGS